MIAGLKVNTLSVNAASDFEHKVILDVDMSTDTDDLLAVRGCERLDNEGKETLIGVCMSVSGGERALASLLTYDGFGDIPVGISSVYIPDESPYWEYLESVSTPSNTMADAVEVYRKLLSESEERVSIITTGYLTNIQMLLESEADEYSDLTGAELIKEKVRAIHITGGNLVDHTENNFMFNEEARIASDYVFANWPQEIPVVIYSQDLGGQMWVAEDLPEDDIVNKCLELADRNGSTAWDIFNVWAFSQMDYNALSDSYLTLAHCSIYIDSDGKDIITDDESAPWWRIKKLSPDNNYYKEQINSML